MNGGVYYKIDMNKLTWLEFDYCQHYHIIILATSHFHYPKLNNQLIIRAKEGVVVGQLI